MMRIEGLIFIFLLGFLSGCGPGDGGRIAITGTLELDGKPLDGASIAFIGGGGGALASATSDKEGKFSVKVAPGPNKVAISKDDPNSVVVPTTPPRDEDMLMGTPEQVAKSQAKKPKELVPAKYANPDSSGLKFDITSGMSPLSISLNSK